MLQSEIGIKRATPESTGSSSKDILDFIDAIEAAELELHSLMVIKNRHVIAEGWWVPFSHDDVHLLYSLSKSFTSTAIGFATQEGLLKIDDPVISFFPDQLPENPSELLASMKVRHLLSMSTGHAADDMTEMVGREDRDWVKGFLAREVVYEPGTHFLYNSSASYILSAIITKLTGLTTLDYLRPRLLDPLGIVNATWETCPKGISVGGWGLSVTTDAIARFGMFYLLKGIWDGHRLLNEAWIEDATSFHISNGDNPDSDWAQGYGFQFWRCRHRAYRGDGAFGQYCIVAPEIQMVIAITSSTSNMQAILDLVWKHLVTPARLAYIPESPDWAIALKAKLATLALPAPKGHARSPKATEISGLIYLPTDEKSKITNFTFDFDDGGCTFTTSTATGEKALRVGTSHWIHSESTYEWPDPRRIATIGKWVTPDAFEIKIRYVESPAGITILCEFGQDTVDINCTLTGRFGPSQGPKFQGKVGSLSTTESEE